jgi:hypothetical protein
MTGGNAEGGSYVRAVKEWDHWDELIERLVGNEIQSVTEFARVLATLQFLQ